MGKSRPDGSSSRSACSDVCLSVGPCLATLRLVRACSSRHHSLFVTLDSSVPKLPTYFYYKHQKKSIRTVQLSTLGAIDSSISNRGLYIPSHRSSLPAIPMKSNVQHSTNISSALPFDIIALIIDNVGDNKDTDVLKKLALVSHSFLQICNKHLFATIDLHDATPGYHVASSKRGFVKLLQSRPDVVKYIRQLTYKVGNLNHSDSFPLQAFLSPPHHPNVDKDDDLLSPTLPNFLRTISRLNSLRIFGSKLDWNTLDSSLTSAFLHLMHLPTVNHIELSCIQNFPLSSLTSVVDLHRLDIFFLSRLNPFEEDGSHEFVVQSGMLPKIREFRTFSSSLLTRKLLHAKTQNGHPAFNFADLRQLTLSYFPEDEQNIRYLLQNAKLLEKLYLRLGYRRNFAGLLSSSARTLKILDLAIPLHKETAPQPLAGLCEELEAMAGHNNKLEALFLEILIDAQKTENFVGSIFQDVGNVLVNPGWSALRQVSFKVAIASHLVSNVVTEKLFNALQSVPDKYLSHLSKLESVALSFSAYVQVAKHVKCD